MKAKQLILAVVAIAMAAAAGMGNAAAATNDVSAILQKGLFEEEANRNLDAAIQQYQAVVAQTDKDRQYGATAVFRLGECYRKQGKTNEAAAQYQRIVRDFPEQTELVNASRQQLGPATEQTIWGVVGQMSIADLKKLSVDARRVVVQQQFPNPVLNTLMTQMMGAEQTLAVLKGKYGDKHPEVVSKEAELKTLEQQIDAQVDAVLASQTMNTPLAKPGQTGSGSGEVAQVSPQEAEVERIRAMIKDSPDLINAHIDSHGLAGGDTLLSRAAMLDELVVARFLLDNKADIEIKSVNSVSTPLMLAAENGHEKMVALLLEHGANVNASAIYPSDAKYRDNGKTALHHAAEHGYKEVAAVLLSHGAEVNAATIEGKTPLYMAAEKGFKAVAELLLTHGADANARTTSGATPLQAAARAGNKAVVELLLANKADVNAKDVNGISALGTAASGGYQSIVELLLAHKADINIQTTIGMTPLMAAIQQHHTELVEMLLSRGADVNARVHQKEHEDAAPGWGWAGWTALHFAVDGNHAPMLKSLLEKGAAPDVTGVLMAPVNLGNASGYTYHDFTPLMLAIYNGKMELAQLLLARKADANFRNVAGETPLLIAEKKGFKEFVELLLDNKGDVNTKDGSGLSLLHHSISDGQKEIVELLLARGASVNVQTPYGGTPLHLAAGQNSKAMVELLLAHGADPNLADKNGNTPLDSATSGQASGFSPGGLPMPPRPPNRPFQQPGQPGQQVPEAPSAIAELLRAHGAVEPKLSDLEIVMAQLSAGTTTVDVTAKLTELLHSGADEFRARLETIVWGPTLAGPSKTLTIKYKLAGKPYELTMTAPDNGPTFQRLVQNARKAAPPKE